jgi:hypothetical protein
MPERGTWPHQLQSFGGHLRDRPARLLSLLTFHGCSGVVLVNDRRGGLPHVIQSGLPRSQSKEAGQTRRTDLARELARCGGSRI